MESADDVMVKPEPTPPPALTAGWVVLTNSRVEHYVVDGKSLCGKWGYLGNTFYPTTNGGCKECEKRLKKWKGT